ncbi:MAG: aldo/keto reductase [Proteobacteria bacterium]|nr:aldo/keto reductase [Pseudomonadota bacterium]
MSIRPRSMFLLCLAAALVVGFTVSGYFLYRTAIGLDPSAFPAGAALQKVGLALFSGLELTLAGLVLTLGTILLAAIASFALVMWSVRARARSADPSRRSFLTGIASGAGAGLAGLVAASLGAFARAAGVGNDGRGWLPVGGEIFGGDVVKTHPEWKREWKGSRVQGYRRLGRTGWEVSDIVMGTGPLDRENGERIVKVALERGINYIDTSPDYSAAGSEGAVGRGLRGVDRSQLFLATKFCTPTGHLPPGTPVKTYVENVEGSLRRLGTDYVDLAHVHSCDEIDRLMDPNLHEAFDRLREAGKVRFLGFSTHTPNLVQVVNAAVDSGRFDVMMVAYHHGIWSQLGEVIDRARREQDMGVVAMKTLKGAKHNGLAGFREQADAYSQAALKWVLSNPSVSCAVISMFKLQHVDEYLVASGATPTSRDLALLREYDRQILGSYCVPHCGACLESCPENLPIHDVLRHRMYFEDYGWEKGAMSHYAALERNAEVCAGCSAPCLGSCPVGIPIQERMIGAHELLTLT